MKLFNQVLPSQTCFVRCFNVRKHVRTSYVSHKTFLGLQREFITLCVQAEDSYDSLPVWRKFKDVQNQTKMAGHQEYFFPIAVLLCCCLDGVSLLHCIQLCLLLLHVLPSWHLLLVPPHKFKTTHHASGISSSLWCWCFQQWFCT